MNALGPIAAVGAAIFVVSYGAWNYFTESTRIKAFQATHSRWTAEDYRKLFGATLLVGGCMSPGYIIYPVPNEPQAYFSRTDSNSLDTSSLGRTYAQAYQPASDPEPIVFSLYQHYQFKGFRDYLKQHESCRQRITELYEKWQHNDHGYSCQSRDQALCYETSNLPSLTQKEFGTILTALYQELEAEYACQRRLEQEQQKKLHAQAAMRSYAEKDLQSPHMRCAADTWKTDSPSPYAHNRYAAYEKACSPATQWREASYTFSRSASALVQEASYTINHYTTCYGNELQQELHGEQWHLLEAVAKLSTAASVQVQFLPVRRAIVDGVDVARGYNQSGSMVKSSWITDACFATLDFLTKVTEFHQQGAAVAREVAKGAALGALEGVGDGLASTANMVIHPIETATGLAHIACSAWNTACSAINSVEWQHVLHKGCSPNAWQQLFEKTTSRENWEYWAERMTLVGACALAYAEEKGAKEIARVGARHVAAFITDGVATKKVFSIAGTTFKTVAPMLHNVAQKTSVKALGALERGVESGGRAAREVHKNIKKAVVGLKPSELLFLSEYVYEAETRLAVLQKFCKCDIDLLHILGIEIKASRLNGFHRDLFGVIEKSGAIEFANKVVDKFGCYSAMLKIDGKVVHAYKTFFPQNWTDEQVVKAIFEAYEKKVLLELSSNGASVFIGRTKEGILVEMVIKGIEIITAYPKIEGI